MDEIDSRLIALLAENARLSLAELARSSGLARTTVKSRLERLEARGIIASYTIRLGATHGPNLRATILLQIEPRTGPGVIAGLKPLSGVLAVHTTSGQYDLLVDVAAETTQDLDDLIDRIVEARGVIRSESLVHLSTKFDRRT